jgi:hypothetical protein
MPLFNALLKPIKESFIPSRVRCTACICDGHQYCATTIGGQCDCGCQTVKAAS